MRSLPLALACLAVASCGGSEAWDDLEDADGIGELESELPSTTVVPANDGNARDAIVRVIDGATTRLDIVQYTYLFDRAGMRPVNDALARALGRGVQVRVLLDDGPAENASAVTQLAGLGITAKKDSASRVTHNKFVLADARVFFTGSANLSSESLLQNHEVNATVTSASLGKKLRAYADAIWADSTRPATITNAASTTTQVLGDAQYGPAALAAIKGANRRVRLVMYSARYGGNRVPPIRDQLVDALRDAKARGVDVKVVLEQSSSAWDRTVTNDNRATATRLRDAGVEVRFDALGTRTHAKLLVADNIVFLGSTNWSSAALEDYHATDLRLKTTALATAYAKYFDAQWSAATP